MTDTAELVDPRNDERWRRFVEQAPGASIFHQPAWLDLLERTYGYRFAACCVTASGRIRAGLPLARVASPITGRRLVALPFSDVCGPIEQSGSDRTHRALVHALTRLRQSMGLHLEIRAAIEDLPEGRLQGGFLQHTLALGPDAQVLERSVSSAARRGVAKARRAGLVAERHTSAWGLQEFYRLHLRTRRRQGVPTQPKRFVMGLERLFDADRGFVLLVRQEEHISAAAVFLTCNGVLTYKYGASDERRLDARPNNLLFMEAMAWGCAHGFHTLDFGRTEEENSGLAAFKRGWGAQERALLYTHTEQDPRSLGEGLPARVLTAAIQRGPVQVSRVAGELLYKHVG